MAGLTPLPTHRLHNSERLTHSQAHSFLSSFLERADVDAGYRPDSTLSERGPQALSTGATPNLTLSYLKRILKGMEGRRIGGAALKAQEEETMTTNTKSSSKKRSAAAANGEDGQDMDLSAKKSRRIRPDDDDPTSPIIDATGENDDDWQDAETFALEQQPLVDQDPDAAEGDPHVPEKEAQIDTVTMSKHDKEERKKMKKLRRKDERSKKEEEKRQGSKMKNQKDSTGDD